MKNLPQPDNKNQAQGFALSVVNSVAYPVGIPAEPDEQKVSDIYQKYSKQPQYNKGIGTYWPTVSDLSHGEYHFKSTFAASQVQVNMKAINFSAGQPVKRIDDLNNYAQKGWQGAILQYAH